MTEDTKVLPNRNVRALQRRIAGCLAQRHVDLTGLVLNSKNQAAWARDAVVGTVPDLELESALNDVRTGSGGELRLPKSGGYPDFHSVRSSCALAVSAFGPWRLEPMSLELAGHSGFTKLRYEVKFPILPSTTKYKTPPHLDIVCWRTGHVIAVESKFIEQIDPKHAAHFDALYNDAIESADQTWQAKVKQLQSEANTYRFFNAAQIVKHYLGLKADRPGLIHGQHVTLLYLYWEPKAPETHEFFALHRAEVSDFAKGLSDNQVSFASLSYRELWSNWKAIPSPILHQHVTALEARYLLDLSACIAD